ncbi:proline/betaine transporter [Rickettsia tamurae]|nr:proline/betaine transporter [Rickettsia tamurae]
MLLHGSIPPLSSRGLTTGDPKKIKKDWIPWSSHGMTPSV